MNLGMLLDMAADGFGDRVVVGRRADGITASGLYARAAAGAQAIADTGADAVVYLATNGPAFPVALFSAARAGVPLVPAAWVSPVPTRKQHCSPRTGCRSARRASGSRPPRSRLARPKRPSWTPQRQL